MPRPVFAVDGHAAFLFDMDGTVLTSIAAAERVWRRWATDHGLDADVFLPTIHGKRAIDSVRASGVAGIDAQAEADAILEAEIQDVDGVSPIEGVADFLRQLPVDRWAIVTSASRRLAEARIAAAGLPMPPILISGDDVPRGKPDPAPFHIGAEALGVATEDCLIFEDAEAGIEAAEAAAAPVLVITAGHPEPLAAAARHERIASYQELALAPRPDGRLAIQRAGG